MIPLPTSDDLAIAMRRSAAAPRPRRAFTLVEVICTIVVISLVAGATSRILFQAFGALNDSSTRSDLHDQLASAMERITSELHTISIKPSSSPATPDITACTAASIAFNNPTAARTIGITGSTILVSGSAKASSIIATGVSAFIIQGYDESDAALPASPSVAQIATIRRIQITITATSNGVTETLRTKVYVRCMALGSGST
jgi:prepilin-type N-terminal cleavage/methylation domain-containing protein